MTNKPDPRKLDRVESPSEAPQAKNALPKLTRRQLGVATAVAIAMGISVEELIRNGWIRFDHDHNHGNEHNEELDEEVVQRLIENARFMRDLDNSTVHATFNAQQAKEAILVPKKGNYKKKCCIDERYKEEGDAEGLAGVGVLMNEEQLAAQASEEVDEIEEAFDKGEEEFTLDIAPHGAGKCGAAKLARVNAKETDLSAEKIDETALAGGNRLKAAIEAEIQKRPKLQGKKITINVKMLEENHFLQAPNHPGAIALHHAHKDMDMNLDRKTGGLMYNIKNIGDGILAAKIALGDHGMEHTPAAVAANTNKFRIVLTGDRQEVANLARAYQQELAKPENAGIRNRIKIETWVMQGGQENANWRKKAPEVQVAKKEPVRTQQERQRRKFRNIGMDQIQNI